MIHYLGVVLVDAGLALAFLGVVSLVRPVRLLRIRTRSHAAAILGMGALLILVGSTLPASETRIETPRTELDRFVPVYQFFERHQIHVAAPPPRAFEAVRSVTASEITLFRTLTAIRRFGRPAPESILNAPGNRPILEVATETGFYELAHHPEGEIVVGTLVAMPRGAGIPDEPTPEWFDSLSGPGYAKAVMSFIVGPDGDGSLVTTETRVYATDDATRRSFTAYWRVIYPGSSLIRWMWLRAIQRRAEQASNTEAR